MVCETDTVEVRPIGRISKGVKPKQGRVGEVISPPHYFMDYEDKTEQLAEINDEAIVYDGLEDALVGWAERFGMPPVAVYDYNKVIECLMEGDEGDEAYENAVEWYGYNTLGSWVGDATPIFIHRFETEEEFACRCSTKRNNWWTKTVRKITETLTYFGDLLRKGGN